ncbi:MAG: helix-turn-helix transcriptional regulator [Spirochaetaceae bacterium]|nr:helix-turn-helix transcriptional regulator [Spirochaetaceae bacterium]
MGAGFVRTGSGKTHILVVNRGRTDRPFSERDMKNMKSMITAFSELYSRLDEGEDDFAANLRRLESLPGFTGLSRRETVVCRMLSNRMTSRNIGKILRISPRTAERHVLNIYTKLNVSNRRELIELVRP